jgi:serine/threonine protein kinase
MAPEFAPGLLVFGRYRLDRELGRGGAGVVWAAFDDRNQSVALKILSHRAGSDPVMRKRFLREARALSDLRHPGIVKVQEVVELDGGSPVIVMEALAGENLRRRLERDRALPVPEAASILAQVASAVAYAHARSIVHRDLKPENVFLCDGEDAGRSVKVLDFGIAKLLADGAKVTSVVTEIGVGLGTLHYAAPEQILSAAEVDHRADVWSLGVILYECLSGFRPIEGATERDLLRRVLTDAIPSLSLVAPDVPDDLSNLVARMLERTPEERLSEVDEVCRLLARHAAPDNRS